MQRNIEQEMKRYNIGLYDIKDLLGCSEKTVRNKLSGVTDFTYEETKKIRNRFFPGMKIEYLFDPSDKPYYSQ